MNCHRKCSKVVGNLCGLDQSQLAGELAKLGMKAEDLSGTKKKERATKKGQSAAPPVPESQRARHGRQCPSYGPAPGW